MKLILSLTPNWREIINCNWCRTNNVRRSFSCMPKREDTPRNTIEGTRQQFHPQPHFVEKTMGRWIVLKTHCHLDNTHKSCIKSFWYIQSNPQKEHMQLYFLQLFLVHAAFWVWKNMNIYICNFHQNTM